MKKVIRIGLWFEKFTIKFKITLINRVTSFFINRVKNLTNLLSPLKV